MALSGGMHSCSVAVIVYDMCELVFKEIKERGNKKVLADLRVIVDEKEFVPESAKEICRKLLYTCYMRTDNSSEKTLNLSKNITETIGANHRIINFQHIFEAYHKLSN